MKKVIIILFLMISISSLFAQKWTIAESTPISSQSVAAGDSITTSDIPLMSVVNNDTSVAVMISVQIEVAFGSTPDDDADVYAMFSVDGTNFDTRPQAISRASLANQASTTHRKTMYLSPAGRELQIRVINNDSADSITVTIRVLRYFSVTNI